MTRRVFGFVLTVLILGAAGSSHAVAQRDHGQLVAQADENCPEGQVMIGGACRVLGKKAPANMVEEPAAEEPQQATDSCPEGQVMIGGKCRVLGKTAPAKTVEEPAAEEPQQATDSCPEGQVMIGGQCRALGKKATGQPAVEPTDTASRNPSDGSEADAPRIIKVLPPKAVGKASEPFAAGSWGGIVRAGPGMDFPKVASLAEGAPIVILERTKVQMNGFPWFKIRLKSGQTGYQWGGILCAMDEPREGLFQTCQSPQ